MKKIIILLSFLSLTALSFGQEVTVDDITYNLNAEDSTAAVAGSTLSNVVIPSTIQYLSQTYTVTSIGYRAFFNCSNLTSITIPNSVTSIGIGTFAECSSLTSITIPNSVTSINDQTFYGCSSLTSITIPNSVTSIESSAFYYCSSLTSITIPNSVTSIGGGAFWGCSSLTSITIPNSVTSINDRTFYGCSSLTSITIPNSVTSINDKTFYGCSSLTSITIPNSVTSIGNNTFDGCSSLTSITIPNSVTSIGNKVFCECSSLTSITIPNSVTSIGQAAFYGCSSLTSVIIPNSVTSISDNAFDHCSSLTSVTIPNSVTNIGDEAFYGCSLDSIIIPRNVTTISNNAFSPLSQITFHADSCTWDATDVLKKPSTLIISDSVRYLTNVRFNFDSTTYLICNAPIPPLCSHSTFSDYSATLHVPYTYLSLYQSAPIWRAFIIEGTGTSYDVTVGSNDSAKGFTEGTGTYGENQNISIKALPKGGYAFTGWNDGDLNNPRSVTVTRDSSFTAIFSPIVSDTVIVRDTVLLTDTVIDTLYITVYETDTIYLEYDSTLANQYTLADYGVYYFMNTVVNTNNIYIKLYAIDGKLLQKGTGDMDLRNYPSGIYIVTDGKGGFLKINHYKQ